MRRDETVKRCLMAGLSVLAAFGWLALPALAQDGAPVVTNATLDWPLGEQEPYAMDTGVLANSGRAAATVYEELIAAPGSVHLRLFFSVAELGPGSFVRVTSGLDGEVQELDLDGLTMWNFSTAYFNGDSVYLELVAAPGTERNRLAIDHIEVLYMPERGPCADDDCGICGSDNRVPSSEEWAARIMPVGCTASIIDESSCAVSAGHCMGSGNILQFNVPDSSSSCYPYDPPIADQFPVTGYLYSNGGVGNDWAVMTIGTNSLGQTPYERYGVFRAIRQFSAPSGSPVDVWGYGVDNNNPTRSQTQQHSSGEVVARYSTYYEYDVDVTYGNSGSALIYDNEIIGIVTHCSYYCQNIATRVDRSDFVQAREQLCGGGGGGYCAATSASTAYEHITNVTVGSIDNDSGSSGYADYTDLSTDMQIGTAYPITVTLYTQWSSDIGGLWVDWNQDQDFNDANETITTSWSGLGPYTATITPPAGAELGATRMRIRIQDGDYDPDLSPCGTTDYGEVEDYTINVVGVVDDTPPSPDPMYFDSPPAPIATSAITMVATTATDDTSPPVYYEFDFVSGGDGGSDSGWQASTTYTDMDLTPNTAYTYRVRARDSASTPNMTGYSDPATAVTYIEMPTGVTFGTVSSSSIQLYVSGALTNLTVGSSGVYFDSTTPGGDGGINQWIQVRNDMATGLTPNTTYTFRVKARNQEAVETPYSATADKTTLADVPGAPLLSNPTESTLDLNVDPAGNPDYTEFAVRCQGTDPYDPAWDGKYVNASGQPSGAKVWRTDSEWGTTTVNGLQPETVYTFAVRARNLDDIETVFGPEASLATTGGPGYGLGDLNCDGVVNAFDIDPFILALTDPAEYEAAYPDCDLMLADIDDNGVVNAFDIDPFIALLTGK